MGAPVVSAREYHVAVMGDDSSEGTASSPLRTISAAARVARPGDVITVHEGVYRERVSPARGGESDSRRIVYQAAPGEKVVIKGSEVVKGWEKVQNDTWKVTVPNSFFQGFNPYGDVIRGDWFSGLGREHHTGAVYLNEHWLTEASTLEQVLAPVRERPLWDAVEGDYLLNVLWLRTGRAAQGREKIPASRFAENRGVQTAPASEGGDCIGFIEAGDWVRYDGVDFGERCEAMEIRAASETRGGVIEIRLGSPDGSLLGTCRVPHTGGWQIWASFNAKIKPTSGVQTVCLVFRKPQPAGASAPFLPRDLPMWFAKVDSAETTIWAQFPGIDPNKSEVEINVRRTVFYPEKTGVDYLTVRGFTMMHAATPWAPPTAEQIGLIGTHWSKGWIIENNDVRYSVCVGIALGKYGDEFDNTSANTAEGYVKTIERALANGWSKEKIGHHVVRNNHISHCEQAGIVGSLGPVFCSITGNEIHDIHVRRLFSGAEMAGIKFHGAIDTEISGNLIYRTCRGLWLDWMAQGTRVSRNIFHDTGPWEDLMVEVDHGPFMVDNNLFLSLNCLFDMSHGGAYVHNLFTGIVGLHPELNRETPFMKPHSTEVAGLHKIPGGDSRFYNNVFANGASLASYDKAALPMFMTGNVFLGGAAPSKHEKSPLVRPDAWPQVTLQHEGGTVILAITFDADWAKSSERPLVTTELLGTAAIPKVPFERPDGTPYRLDTDFFGSKRDAGNPFPGPFEVRESGRRELRIWPAGAEK